MKKVNIVVFSSKFVADDESAESFESEIIKEIFDNGIHVNRLIYICPKDAELANWSGNIEYVKLENEELAIEKLSVIFSTQKIHYFILGQPQFNNDKKIVDNFNEFSEKVTELVKTLQPFVFTIGAKVLYDSSTEQLFDACFAYLRKYKNNLVVGRELAQSKGYSGIIVYPEKKYDKIYGLNEFVKQLTDVIFKRGETRYISVVNENAETSISDDLYSNFYSTGKLLFAEGLLPVVECGTYGNMSVRTDNGLIITGRNVNKGNLPKNHLIEINSVQYLEPQEDKALYAIVKYNGEVKPSIDTVIHHKIYDMTGFNAILHVHTDDIFELPITDYNYPCGTEEELKSIIKNIDGDNVDIIQMYKHGLIIMGETLDDCFKKLKKLFNEGLAINKLDREKDKHIIKEWDEHHDEVYGRNSFVAQNKDKHYLVKRGRQKCGFLYMDVQKDKIVFIVYILKELQEKLGLGRNIINLIEIIAKSRGIEQLKILTVEKCRVKDYYIKRHGFELESEGDYINLVRTVR